MHHGAGTGGWGLFGLWLMWLAMSAAMMGPIVFPWLRAVRRLQRSADASAAAASRAATPLLPVTVFALGYGVAWAAFSAGAAALQHVVAIRVAPGPWIAGAPLLGGASLVLAGGFQFTRLKDACLTHCRSPMGYLLAHWRPGLRGAWGLGLRHGLFCLGCCWALMALALVTGAMTPLAMALLTALMVTEILSPVGPRVVRPIGGVLVLAGLALLLGTALGLPARTP